MYIIHIKIGNINTKRVKIPIFIYSNLDNFKNFKIIILHLPVINDDKIQDFAHLFPCFGG